MFTDGIATRTELYGTPSFRVAAALRSAFAAVTVAGALAAGLLGSGWAGVLLLAGVTGAVAAQLAVGILGYRRAMGRDWPRVEPVPDEDDW